MEPISEVAGNGSPVKPADEEHRFKHEKIGREEVRKSIPSPFSLQKPIRDSTVLDEMGSDVSITLKPVHDRIKAACMPVFGSFQRLLKSQIKNETVQRARNVFLRDCPMKNSQLMVQLRPFLNNPNRPAPLMHGCEEVRDENSKKTESKEESMMRDRIFLTFFTSGVAFFNHPSEYYGLLPFKAADFKKGIVLTDNQIAHQIFGNVAFIDIDFRHSNKVPSVSVISKYIHLCFKTAVEMFPTAPSYTTVVSVSPPKIKEIKKENLDAVSFGIHIVFPDIVVVDCQQLRIFVDTVGARTDAYCAEFKGSVDSGCINASSTHLRPNGSYKAVPCLVCSPIKKAQPFDQDLFAISRFPVPVQSRKDGARPVRRYEDICDDDPQGPGSSCPGRCFNGKKIPGETYRLGLIIVDEDAEKKKSVAYRILKALIKEVSSETSPVFSSVPAPISKKQTSASKRPSSSRSPLFRGLSNGSEQDRFQILAFTKRALKPRSSLAAAVETSDCQPFFELPLSDHVTEAELKLTSISREDPVHPKKRTPVQRAEDTPDGLPPLQALQGGDMMGLMYDKDKKSFQTATKGLIPLSFSGNRGLYKTVASVLRKNFSKTFTKYTLVSMIKRSADDRKSPVLFVSTQGKGCTNCPYKPVVKSGMKPSQVLSNPEEAFRRTLNPQAHKTSNLYYLVFLGGKEQRIEIRCHMKDCQSIQKEMGKLIKPNTRGHYRRNAERICYFPSEIEVTTLQSLITGGKDNSSCSTPPASSTSKKRQRQPVLDSKGGDNDRVPPVTDIAPKKRKEESVFNGISGMMSRLDRM